MLSDYLCFIKLKNNKIERKKIDNKNKLNKMHKWLNQKTRELKYKQEKC